jgi:putative salt-induced outer membrane protein YdiY
MTQAPTWSARLQPSVLALILLVCATVTNAQVAPKEPPPLWDAQVGAAFVGTSGNSDTSTIGADFSMHRRWPLWQIESIATAVRSSEHGVTTAERFLGELRGDRVLGPRLKLSVGQRAERDHLDGIDLRSVTDVGLKYAIVHEAAWTLDSLTSLAFDHELTVVHVDRDDPVGVAQLFSKFIFTPSSDTTQRFTFYPDFKDTSAYRAEAELTAQAAMTTRLALKLGYLWRYTHAPITGFKTIDNTATASVVVRWKAATAAPAP